MARFLEHVIASCVWLGMIGLGCWFGGPIIYHHFLAAEQAVQTVKVQGVALQADTAAANKQQASCADEVSHAMDAAKAIAAVSKPQPVAAGKPQVLITSDQIRGMIQ